MNRGRFVLVFYAFVLSFAMLLGSVGWSEAAVQNLPAPKTPKWVDQSPDAPKLVARDNYYSPKYLEVRAKPGTQISLKNIGAIIHGFMIPKFPYQSILNPGETKKITVPQNATAGFYEFFCPFHPGMRGTIEVLPKRS
jgi:plastocyanin